VALLRGALANGHAAQVAVARVQHALQGETAARWRGGENTALGSDGSQWVHPAGTREPACLRRRRETT
jgi:hypothetical protein